jgi:hypothetical protein
VLAKEVGLEQALITPFVALLIQSMGTLSVKAWCAMGEIPNDKIDVREKSAEQTGSDEKKTGDGGAEKR